MPSALSLTSSHLSGLSAHVSSSEASTEYFNIFHHLSPCFYFFITFHYVMFYYLCIHLFKHFSVLYLLAPLNVGSTCVVTVCGLLVAGSLKLRADRLYIVFVERMNQCIWARLSCPLARPLLTLGWACLCSKLHETKGLVYPVHCHI